MSTPRSDAPPPVDERYRIPLRVVVIVASYLVYFFLSNSEMVAAIFLGLGLALVGLSQVDRWTLRSRDRSGLLQVGTTLLGLGLLGLGAYLWLR